MDLYGADSASVGRAPEVRAARRAALRQRHDSHRSRPQQDPQGLRRQVPHDGGLRRAVRAGLGLPRPADRAEGRPRARPEEAADDSRPSSAARAGSTPRSSSTSSATDFKRLGVFGDWDDPYLTMELRATKRPSCGRSGRSSSRDGLQGQEAGALVHPLPDGARRGRGRVRAAHARRRSTSSSRSTPRAARSSRRGCPARRADAVGAHLDDDALDDSVQPGCRLSSRVRVRRLRGRTARGRSWRTALVDRGRARRPAGRSAEHGRRASPATRSKGCGSGIRCTTATRVGVLADYVTLEQGTGVVHTAPGHGADDFNTGVQYGLDIYAPVGPRADTSRTMSGMFAGMRVFDANPRIEEALAASAAALAPRDVRALVPALLALPQSGHLPRDLAVVHRDGRAASSASARSRRSARRAVGAGVGAGAHPRHAREPARLVHLAPARLGRADPGVDCDAVRRGAPHAGD